MAGGDLRDLTDRIRQQEGAAAVARRLDRRRPGVPRLQPRPVARRPRDRRGRARPRRGEAHRGWRRGAADARRGRREEAGGARRGARRGEGRPARAALKVLALDYGSARTGVAVSDPTGTLARPLCTVEQAATDAGLARLGELVRGEEAERVVVGLPLTLRGEHGAQAEETMRFVDRLRARRRRARRDLRRALHDDARRARAKATTPAPRPTSCPATSSGRGAAAEPSDPPAGLPAPRRRAGRRPRRVRRVRVGRVRRRRGADRSSAPSADDHRRGAEADPRHVPGGSDHACRWPSVAGRGSRADHPARLPPGRPERALPAGFGHPAIARGIPVPGHVLPVRDRSCGRSSSRSSSRTSGRSGAGSTCGMRARRTSPRTTS